MSADHGETTTAFFHDPDTHKLISELSGLSSLTLYVGAGASIGRTGLTWAGLSAQMLDAILEGTYAQWVEIVRAAPSPLTVSSAIAQHYFEAFSAHWRDRLYDAIHGQLYTGPSEETSFFSDRVLALANSAIGAGKSAVIVTPNYDDFLIDAANRLKKADRQFTNLKVITFGVNRDGVPLEPNSRMREVKRALSKDKQLCIVYLHGLITNERKEPEIAYPIVSERDYAITREVSQEVLGTLFQNRDVVIVGSSLTDPPLIHALSVERTVKTTTLNAPAVEVHARKRFAIIPRQGSEPGKLETDETKKYHELERLRAHHLDIELVRPPYYYQAPQILEETRIDLRDEHGGRMYTDSDAQHRYGVRLMSWWKDWSDRRDLNPEEKQRAAYQFLKTQALPEVRKLLGFAGREDLKLEAWVRWEPEERQLALWASSTGDWPEPATMRKVPIQEDSKFTAVMSLLNGAPTYAKGEPSFTRWGSFLSVPIHYQSPRDEVLPVGALCLASMKPQEEGSLNPRKRAGQAQLFVYLSAIGSLLMDPGYPFWAAGNRTAKPLDEVG